jgi:hypothetical protein
MAGCRTDDRLVPGCMVLGSVPRAERGDKGGVGGERGRGPGRGAGLGETHTCAYTYARARGVKRQDVVGLFWVRSKGSRLRLLYACHQGPVRNTDRSRRVVGRHIRSVSGSSSPRLTQPLESEKDIKPQSLHMTVVKRLDARYERIGACMCRSRCALYLFFLLPSSFTCGL